MLLRVINTYFRFRMPKIYKECQLCFTVHRQPSKTETKNRIINITQHHEINTQKKKKKTQPKFEDTIPKD